MAVYTIFCDIKGVSLDIETPEIWSLISNTTHSRLGIRPTDKFIVKTSTVLTKSIIIISFTIA